MKKLFNCIVLCALLFIICGTKKTFCTQPHKLTRIGTNYGGWTIPDDILTSESICYCAGAGEDISFDIGLVNQYKCNAYILDPTPKAIKHVASVKDALHQGKECFTGGLIKNLYKLDASLIEHVHFSPVGLWNQDETLTFYLPKNPDHVSCSALNLQNTLDTFAAPCKKLATLMQHFGHTKIDLLKMDIEGAEYPVIENMIHEQILPHILCIEFHSTKEFDKQKSIDALKQKGYILLHCKGTTDYTFLLS